MKGIGLFNMAYGTAGLVSSLKLSVDAGLLVSMWTMSVGAAMYLGRDLHPLRYALALLRQSS